MAIEKRETQGSFITITGLKSEVMNAKDVDWNYPAPQFAYMNNIENPVGERITWYFWGIKYSIYDAKEYWKKLQVSINFIDAVTRELSTLRCNMSALMRSILNRLASQEKLGLIRIELWNVPSTDKDWNEDKTKRKAVASVFNDGQKITTKKLDFDEQVKAGTIKKIMNPQTGVENVVYHSVADIESAQWFDGMLLAIIEDLPLADLPPKLEAPEVEDGIFGDDDRSVEELTAVTQPTPVETPTTPAPVSTAPKPSVAVDPSAEDLPF